MNKPSYIYSAFLEGWVPSDTPKGEEALLLKGYEVYKNSFNPTPFYDREKSFAYLKTLVERTNRHHIELGYMYLSRFHDPNALELAKHHLKKGHYSESPVNEANAQKYYAREALLRMSPDLYNGVRGAMLWIDSVQRKVLGTKYGSKGDYFGEKGISPPHICGASIFCRTGDYYSYENMKSDPNSFFAFDPFEHWFSRSELRELHNVLHSRRNPYFNLEHMRPVLELLGTFIEEEHYNPNLDDILIARNYYSSIQDKPEFSHQIIKGNTLRFGPYYNAIAQNGLPVLGEYVEQYVDATHPNHLRPLNSKITHFIGLIGTPNGGIDFDFGAKDGKPVTITEEDIDVSLVLAFAYDKPLDVTIDMASRSHLSFFSTDIQEKVFEPVWLAETDIGKTSFITDFLAGRFAWHADQFEIGKGASNHSRQKAQDLIQKILSVPSNDPSDKVSIVNINPAFVKLDVGVIDCPNDTNLIGIRVAEVKIQIDGGYTHDTTSRDWHHRNDLRFSHPQITKILTDEFNLIAQLVPVFERFRQCVALSNALTLLRQKGFEPNASLSAHIQEKREEFENRIAGKPPEYAIPIPFFYKPEVK